MGFWWKVFSNEACHIHVYSNHNLSGIQRKTSQLTDFWRHMFSLIMYKKFWDNFNYSKYRAAAWKTSIWGEDC